MFHSKWIRHSLSTYFIETLVLAKLLKSLFDERHSNTIAKTFEKYLYRIREYASDIQNVFCMESWMKGRRISQLGSTINLAYMAFVSMGAVGAEAPTV